MINGQSYPRYRAIGGGPGLPLHVVHLFKNGHNIGRFTFPASDPRFVTDRDLFSIAFEQIKGREKNANDLRSPYSGDISKDSWDRFEIRFYGKLMVGNTRGEYVDKVA